MLWVGVRYSGIALPEIMARMREWLDAQRYQPKIFEYAIAKSGTLIRAQFERAAEAADFAEAFAGWLSRERPSMESSEGMKANAAAPAEDPFRGS
jgi:hypothetical protein